MSGAALRLSPGEPATAMIVVRDLVKRYPKRPTNAVDGISFAVARGEIFGLLGPNGAGKTTTLGVLTTRVRPTSGRAEVGGIDVAAHSVAARRQFAVVPQRNNLDRALTARQNLEFHAAYFGLSRQERRQRADRLLEQFGLGDRGADKVDNYSGGMAQRLMIARALMHDPGVLFLDEPTTGLDPQARLFVWDRVQELNRSGLTVILTTHDMDEAETLCRRVAIMDHGKILALDTPESLKLLVPGASALEIRAAVPNSNSLDAGYDSLLRDLGALPEVDRADLVRMPATASAPAVSGQWELSTPADGESESPGGRPVIRLYTQRAAALISPATSVVMVHGGEIEDIHIMRASLEDVFIHMTGRALR